jgi:hypothetical protein
MTLPFHTIMVQPVHVGSAVHVGADGKAES